MIKYTFENKKDGSSGLGLIVTNGNIERLKKNQPIFVDLREVGLGNIRLMISYSPDESAAMKSIKRFIGPDTNIIDI